MSANIQDTSLFKCLDEGLVSLVSDCCEDDKSYPNVSPAVSGMVWLPDSG